jgi:dephospho-CoA kinase
MAVVAVTGGIAAGKSLVTARLRELGAIVIDADQLARDAVEPGSKALEALTKRFGPGIKGPQGELNRGALGERVFGNPEALADLNSIVHPEVKKLYESQLSQAHQEHPHSVIVYDIPLLAEARARDEFDAVVVVDAPATQRIQRLVMLRGLSESEARKRVDSQASDEERLLVADVVIDASRSEAETLKQSEALYRALEELWPDRLNLLPRQFPGNDS